jgi:GDPmannose 4,6-dehydratase
MAFAEIGVELEFTGNDENEIGKVKSTTGEYRIAIGTEVVKVDPRYYRPTEVDLLIGDPAKANTKLGWKPKYTLDAMVKEMVAADIIVFKQEQLLKNSGFTINKEQE